MSLRHFFTKRYDDVVSGACESVDDVATKETGGTEDCCSVSCFWLVESEIQTQKGFVPPSEDRPPCTLIMGFPVLVI